MSSLVRTGPAVAYDGLKRGLMPHQPRRVASLLDVAGYSLDHLFVTKRVDVRLRWFDQGAPMLRHVLNQLGLGDQMPPQGDFYACPMCLKVFPREAAIDGRLTEEHVPPRKLGGKRIDSRSSASTAMPSASRPARSNSSPYRARA
jgi:hypothetical protein